MDGVRAEMRGGRIMVTDYTPLLPMAGGPIYLSFMRGGQEDTSNIVKLTFQDKYVQLHPAPSCDPGFQKECQELNSFKQNSSTTSIVTSVQSVQEPTGNVTNSNGTLNEVGVVNSNSSLSTLIEVQNINRTGAGLSVENDAHTINSDSHQSGSFSSGFKNDARQRNERQRGLNETNSFSSQGNSILANETPKGPASTLKNEREVNGNIQKKGAKRRREDEEFQKNASSAVQKKPLESHSDMELDLTPQVLDEHYLNQIYRDSSKRNGESRNSLDDQHDSSDSDIHIIEQDEDPLNVEGTESKLYHCSLCTNVYLTPGDLSSHLYQTHVTRPRTCPICYKVLYDDVNLRGHINGHVGHKPYKCSVKDCPKTYSCIGSLRKHVSTNHSPNQSKSLDNSASHRPSSSSSIANDQVQVNFGCSICPENFQDADEWSRHIFDVHVSREGPHTCPLCSKTTGSRASLASHIGRHSSDATATRIGLWSIRGLMEGQ